MTTLLTYSIGYQRRLELLRILDQIGYGAAPDIEDIASIERLYRGEGTDNDVELAAGFYEQVGKGANAAELRRGCYGPGGPDVS